MNSKIQIWLARLLIVMPVFLLLSMIGGGYLFDRSGLLPYTGIRLSNPNPRYTEGTIFQNGHDFRYSIYDGVNGVFPELTVYDREGNELVTVGGNAGSAIGMCDLNHDGRTDIYVYENTGWPYHRHRILYYVDGEYRYLWDPSGGFRHSLLRIVAWHNVRILYWAVPCLLLVLCGVALTVKRKRWSTWEIAPLALFLVLALLPLFGRSFTAYPRPDQEELIRMADAELERITYIASSPAAAEALEPAPRPLWRWGKLLAPHLIETIGDQTERTAYVSFNRSVSKRRGDVAHLVLCAFYRMDDPEWFLTGKEREAQEAVPYFDRFEAYLSRPGNLEKLQKLWRERI